jgi:hypothetical protein
MEESTPFSVQSMLVRQIQVAEGNTPCFATTSSYNCSNNKECCWRHDCFDEALDIRLQKNSV